MPRDTTALPSRTWSCSDLATTHKGMLEVKNESESRDDLEKKIKEYEQEILALRKRATEEGDEESTQPATEAKVKESLRRRRGRKKTAAKAKAVAPPESQETEAARSPKELETKNTPMKENKRCPKGPESTPEAVVPSPAPPVLKRQRGKQAAPDSESQVQSLKEANAKMQERLAAMEKEMIEEKKKNVASKSAASSPALKPSDPKPKKKPAAKDALARGASDESGSDGKDEEISYAAKLGRLRRLCERKPSGKLKVPKEIHDRWTSKGHLREELLRELEKADWDEDLFLQRVTRIHETTAKKKNTKRRGWYTKEGMERKLQFSKSYIASVVKFCEKPGNERLIRKDKYNKKLKKYYVEIDEDDESIDEDVDILREEEQEAGGPVKLDRLKKKMSHRGDLPAEGAEDSESEDEPKGRATQANGGPQEYKDLKKLGDSLLTRSSKISDLIAKLESEVANKSEHSTEQKRVQRSIKPLEAGIEILETQFEAIENCKAEVSELLADGLEEGKKKMMIEKVEGQIKNTTVACTKVTTAEQSGKNLFKSVSKKE